MKVQGSDCSIVIKTYHKEMDVPYSEETIREKIALLQEEAAIEGDGTNRAIQKGGGVIGCIVTPLTIGTVPLLLCLVMGSAEKPIFVSETRDLYLYKFILSPMEDTDCFGLIQDRNNQKWIFNSCRIKGFELRIIRDEAIKLKLDICGERSPEIYPYSDTPQCQTSEMSGTAIGRERFYGENVKYRINGNEYEGIYGLTIVTKKEGGTRTEIWVKRVLEEGSDLPQSINEMVITARLLRDKYENRHFGTFRITVKQLVLAADETSINSVDTVIGPLRYYIRGTVTAEAFSSGGEIMP